MTRWCIVFALLALPVFADETMLPVATNAAGDSNTSCDASAHGSLDEDSDTPTGNCGVGGSGVDCCRADSNNVNWTLMLEMDDPTESLTDGADLQSITFYVESFDEGQGSDPTIQVNIYDTTTVACDTLHESGSSTTLTDAGFPAQVTELWNSAGLSGSADVCLQIVCTKTGGAPGNRNSCDIDAIEWNTAGAAVGGRTRRIF